MIVLKEFMYDAHKTIVDVVVDSIYQLELQYQHAAYSDSCHPDTYAAGLKAQSKAHDIRQAAKKVFGGGVLEYINLQLTSKGCDPL